MTAADPTGLTRTQASAAVGDAGWRYLLASLHTSVPVGSLAEGARLLAELVGALGPEADGHLRADVRPDRLELSLQTRALATVTQADVDLARRATAQLVAAGASTGAAAGTAAGRSMQALEIAVDALDIAAVRPFWAAVLGLVPEPGDEGPEGALVDPAGQLPSVWFQQMDAPREQRNRIHLDITVPHDEAPARIDAALAAGGVLLDDSRARSFWILADAEGNEVCVCTWQDRDERDASRAAAASGAG